MVDRQQLEALLANRFPGATPAQIAAAANAIIAMVGSAEDRRDKDRSGFERIQRGTASRLR